jgi:hypothetical protein
MIAASAILAVAERAAAADGHERAAALAQAALGDPAEGVPAGDLPLGRRDAALLRLYRDVRGPVVEALATCPACDTTLDVHLPVAELVAAYDAGGSAGDPAPLDLGTVQLQLRWPATSDLQAVAAAADVESAAAALLARCVVGLSRPDGSQDPLDPAERIAVADHLEQTDPLVDTRVEVSCGDCGETWTAFLDVPELAWSQLRGRARRLLHEVDALARRYGWSEAQILELSEARRSAYLELG